MRKGLLAFVLALALVLSCFSAGMAESEEMVLSLYTDRVYRTMNQWQSSDGNVFEVMGAYSEGLLRLNENHEPIPALAESFELSEDGTVYTFKLREGLTWSNGTPLTASDFVFAWTKSIEDPDYGYATVIASFLKNGKGFLNGEMAAEEVGVKAIDDVTFEVTLEAPAAFFDRLITLPVFFPLNEAFVNEKGDQYALTAADLLYCGPFVCTEFDLAVGATLVKNENYWDAENVALDKAIFRVITEGSAALNAYEAGEVDRVNLTSADVPAYSSNPEFGTYSDFRNYYIQYDTTNADMNINIRKAIGYAIDRDMMAYGILGTGAVPAGGIVSQGINGDGTSTFRELNGALSRYEPELAKEFWAKGVEELGYEPKLTMLTPTGPDFDDVAVFIQDQLRTVLGTEVTINSMTQKARSEIMNTESYNFALSAWGADYDDGMTYLELWTNDTGFRGNYAAPAYVELVSKAMAEPVPATRLDYMLAAEKLLVDEDAVVSGLYDRGFSYLQKANVKGLIFHPVGQPLDIKGAVVE